LWTIGQIIKLTAHSNEEVTHIYLEELGELRDDHFAVAPEIATLADLHLDFDDKDPVLVVLADMSLEDMRTKHNGDDGTDYDDAGHAE
jgi:hypothetical protein